MRMLETIIIVIVVIGFGTLIYKEGKRLGLAKPMALAFTEGGDAKRDWPSKSAPYAASWSRAGGNACMTTAARAGVFFSYQPAGSFAFSLEWSWANTCPMPHLEPRTSYFFVFRHLTVRS